VNFNSVNDKHLVLKIVDLPEHIPQFSGIVDEITIDIHNNTKSKNLVILITIPSGK
jgi:hypothetical protein